MLLTVGHSTRSFDELVALLDVHGVELLVDVRTLPRSRRHPHFNREALAVELPGHGIAYEHAPALGGLRQPRADSPNGGWRNAGFRGYADHMATDEFATAVEALRAHTATRRTAVMCAEAVPWRCHRQLLADAFVARGDAVEHILDARRCDPHHLTAFAHVVDGRVRYPPPEDAPRLFG